MMILILVIVVLVAIYFAKNNKKKQVKETPEEGTNKVIELEFDKKIIDAKVDVKVDAKEVEQEIVSEREAKEIIEEEVSATTTIEEIISGLNDDVEKRKQNKINEKVAYLDSLKTANLYNLTEALDKKFLQSIIRKKDVEVEKFMKVSGTREKPNSYILLDVETTGLNEFQTEIIQIKAMKISLGKATSIFNTYVKPKRKISKMITSINGITNDDVKDAKSIEEVLPHFIKFIGKDIIIGHNIEFDMMFILASAYQLGYKRLTNKTIDTLKICESKLRESEYDFVRDKDKIVRLESYRLDDLAAYFDTQHIPYDDKLKSLKICDSIYRLMKDVDTKYVLTEDICVFEV